MSSDLKQNKTEYRYSEIFGHTIQGEGKKKREYQPYGIGHGDVISVAMGLVRKTPQTLNPGYFLIRKSKLRIILL